MLKMFSTNSAHLFTHKSPTLLFEKVIDNYNICHFFISFISLISPSQNWTVFLNLQFNLRASHIPRIVYNSTLSPSYQPLLSRGRVASGYSCEGVHSQNIRSNYIRDLLHWFSDSFKSLALTHSSPFVEWRERVEEGELEPLKNQAFCYLGATSQKRLQWKHWKASKGEALRGILSLAANQ